MSSSHDPQGNRLPVKIDSTSNGKFAPIALERDYMAWLGADSFIKDVFPDSDTDMMVLSFIPSEPDTEPLTIEEAAAWQG